MLTRLKFARAPRQFFYDTDTGEGYSFVSYSIFQDTVIFRTSKFGYVTGKQTVSRSEYERRVKKWTDAGWLSK